MTQRQRFEDVSGHHNPGNVGTLIEGGRGRMCANSGDLSQKWESVKFWVLVRESLRGVLPSRLEPHGI